MIRKIRQSKIYCYSINYLPRTLLKCQGHEKQGNAEKFSEIRGH